MITNNTFHPCRSLQVQPNYHFYFTNYKKNGNIECLGNLPKVSKLKKLLKLESKPWNSNLNSAF